VTRWLGKYPPQGLLLNGLHLTVLWAFAAAQPLFSDLDASFFLNYGSRPADIVALALLAVLAVPALLLTVEALLALVEPRAGDALHLGLVALLAALLASQVLARDANLPAGLHLIAVVLAGVAFAGLYARAETLRSVLTVLSPTPVVFVGVFLLLSPTSKIVLAKGTSPARRAPAPDLQSWSSY
jgi:hypothetical protein